MAEEEIVEELGASLQFPVLGYALQTASCIVIDVDHFTCHVTQAQRTTGPDLASLVQFTKFSPRTLLLSRRSATARMLNRATFSIV